MLTFLGENLPSILAGLFVIAVLAVVIHSMVKDKKQGKSSCGCSGCSGCSGGGCCHK